MKFNTIIVYTTIIFFASATIISCFYLPTIKTSANENIGYLTIKVVNDQTGEPINNANVCVIEEHAYYTTNKYGVTQKISLSTLTKKNQTSEDAGYYTIMAYKNGFNTSICFNVKIFESTHKVGFVIKLTPIINPIDKQITIQQEDPSEEFIDQIILHYKK